MWLCVRGGTWAARSGILSLYSGTTPGGMQGIQTQWGEHSASILQAAVEVALYSIQDLNSKLDVRGTS